MIIVVLDGIKIMIGGIMVMLKNGMVDIMVSLLINLIVL